VRGARLASALAPVSETADADALRISALAVAKMSESAFASLLW